MGGGIPETSKGNAMTFRWVKFHSPVFLPFSDEVDWRVTSICRKEATHCWKCRFFIFWVSV